MHDDRQRQKAIGHLSDAGDLKSWSIPLKESARFQFSVRSLISRGKLESCWFYQSYYLIVYCKCKYNSALLSV